MSRILSRAAIATIVLSMAIAMPVFALQSAGSATSSSPAAKTDPVYTVPKAVPLVEPQAPAIAPSDVVTVTILHTNDFHGRLESDSSGRGGSAYIADVVDQVRADKGADNVLLVDAGDIFFGAPPISQLLLGESTIDIYNLMGYDVAAFGNHEFDKGQTVLISRTTQSNFPWVGANIVLSGTTWEHPTWVKPYVTMTVGSPNSVTLGIIGLDTDETPLVTLKGTTDGLVFEDMTDAVLHYYDEVMAQSDALIVLVHMGTGDSGPYKGLATVARELVDEGKPVDLMIGGHQHENMPTPTVISDTTIIVAYQYGRVLGDAEVAIDTTAKSLSLVDYAYHTITNGMTANTVISDRVAYWASKVVTQVNQPVGTSYISLTRDYNDESIMGDLVADSMLWKADEYDDGEVNGSVDIAFTNPGGLRADIVGLTSPYSVTWGDTFDVLPFANTLFYMDLTGAQIQALLDQAATLYKGILQTSGATWYWYNDTGNDSPTAWGAYGVMVNGEPLERDEVYRVVTNNFLAGGQDGWVTFADGTNRWDSYFDMQDGLNEYIATVLGGVIDANSVQMGRIMQLDKVVTILHTNDVHGVFPTASYYGTPEGMTYLATHIANERAKNPNALLLDAGDTFQGNAFAQFFRNSDPNPIAGAMNLLDYDAFVIGNHEYNFGPATFATMLGQLNFPILGSANVDDDGSYGFINGNVEDYITVTVDGLDVAIFGLTNPRVYRYELPTNIPGLTFYPATSTAQSLVPAIQAAEAPDLLLGLTHIGYSPYGDELDSDVLVAEQVPGIDAIVGGHSHTFLDPAVLVTSTVNPTGTLIAQTGRYAQNLGKVNIGFTGNMTDGYDIVLREGYLLSAADAVTDTAMVEYLEPFVITLTQYTETPIGQTTVPIDALEAYTEETNGANLQVDAAVFELAQNGIDVDFHLSGAMSNRRVADGATATEPVTLTIGDMYDLMPYENSLVALEMNGAQIKQILERSYRNWYYYKYVPGYGGYSHYTTCMLDISEGGKITYEGRFPDGDNVKSVTLNGVPLDLTEATSYTVSTVNYLAAGSCNFNDDGITIWPLDQVVADTQFYVRDSVIDYVTATGTISPQVEGRLVFEVPDLSTSSKTVVDASGDNMAQAGEILTYTITITNSGVSGAAVILTDTLPAGLTYVDDSLVYNFPPGSVVTVTGNVLTAHTSGFPVPVTGGSLFLPPVASITFAAQVSDPVPEGEAIINTIELADQLTMYDIAPAVMPLEVAKMIYLPIVMKNS
jgi:2',3'-cyclic-nucleotide 2'-phosphodiesterase/3'-nucleotidase/5'-nucleotidase